MLYRRLKNRLVSAFASVADRLNWIDPACSVADSATISGSRLHGSVRVGEYAKLYRVLIVGSVDVGYSTSLWGPEIEIHARKHAVRIGNYCSIARGVSIYEYFHDYGRLSTYFIGRNIMGRAAGEDIESKGPIEIGHDVWVGAYAHIMSGVVVGNGAVIAANSVVTRAVPAFAIVAGCPARVLKYRFDEATRRHIEALGWWNWDRATIRSQPGLFLGKFQTTDRLTG